MTYARCRGVAVSQTVLPEHLELSDCFFVKYSSAAGQQRELAMHTDGSIFSFNILLNESSAFVGGGTLFEASGILASTRRGGCIGHSGQVRHCGVAITSGERYLLVGFVGCATHAYSAESPAQAAADSFSKFGLGAWDRSPHVAPQLVSPTYTPVD